MSTMQMPIITEPEKIDTIPTIYCNQVRVSMSGVDCTIDVGRADFTKITHSESGAPIIPVDFKAHIVMSPQETKMLTMMLVQTIQTYERDFGEIKLQPKSPPEHSEAQTK
jgi:hypothetical protein